MLRKARPLRPASRGNFEAIPREEALKGFPRTQASVSAGPSYGSELALPV